MQHSLLRFYALFLLLIPQCLWAAPTYVETTPYTTATFTNSGSFSHTVTAGTNNVLIALVGQRTGSGTVALSTLTYNSVSMTKLINGNDASQYVSEIWYLANPASGSHTMAWTSPANMSAMTIQAVTVSGVNQSAPFRNAGTCGTGNSATPSVTVTSATGDLVVDSVMKQATTGTLAQGSGQTLIADTAPASQIRGGGSYESGASSVVMDWTITSNIWVTCGGSLQPPSTAQPRRPPLIMSILPILDLFRLPLTFEVHE